MKNLNRIHLSGLRAAEAVGRLGSLRAAADELGVTPGAVSQQVQKVEGQLGRLLFLRTPKGLVPASDSLPLLRRMTSGMAELSGAVDMALGGHPNRITISVAPVFAAKWLVWRLPSFQAAHPDIQIGIDASASYVDPDRSEADACVRVGGGHWPESVVEKLAGQHVFPVCSPLLGERLKQPSDLPALPVIRDKGSRLDWNLWLKPNGLESAQLSPGPVYSDASLCVDAAIAGQGVFLAWETLAEYALRAGHLVMPFPDRYPSGDAYWFVTGRVKRAGGAVRAFRDWLRTELRASDGEIST